MLLLRCNKRGEPRKGEKCIIAEDSGISGVRLFSTLPDERRQERETMALFWIFAKGFVKLLSSKHRTCL